MSSPAAMTAKPDEKRRTLAKSPSTEAGALDAERALAGTHAGMPRFAQPWLRTAPKIQLKCSACAQSGNLCPACEEAEKEKTIQRKPKFSGAPFDLQRQPRAGDSGPAASSTNGSASSNASSTDSGRGSGTPASPASPQALIVEDDAQQVDPAQMKKSAFLSQLRAAAGAAAEDELQNTPWLGRVGPMVAQFAAPLGNQTAASVEASVKRQAPGAGGSTTAAGLIPPVAARVRQEVRRQTSIGGMMGSAASALSNVASSVSGVLSGVGRLLFKKKDSAEPAATSDSTGGVERSLGAGRPLDTRMTSRMSAVYGHDFSGVRVHTDAEASRLTDKYGARAFTLGSHIAFAPGEYEPGTPIGDALVAHELAHVVQQSGAAASDRPLEKGGGAADSFESEADEAAAVGAVASLWGGPALGFNRLTTAVRTRLKSGLRLQSCSRSVKRCPRGRSWQVVGRPAGMGSFGCLCSWRCLPGGAIDTGGTSGPSISCPADNPCPQPSVEVVDEDYHVEEQGQVTGYGAQMMLGDPMAGTQMCGCMPLDIEGNRTGGALVPTGFDPTHMYAGPMPGQRGVSVDTTEPPRAAIVEPAGPRGGAVEVASPGAGGPRATPQAVAPVAPAPPITPAAAAATPQVTPAVTPAAPPPAAATAGGGPAPGGGPGVMVRTVTGSTTIVDSNIAISLDRAARGLPLNEAQQANVNFARQAGIVVATPTTSTELAQGGGATATVIVTEEVPIPAADRQQIVTDLQAAGVGGGAADREVVTGALLARAEPGVTPTLATADRGVINPLGRLANIPVDRLGGFRNVAEWLRYNQGTDSFTVTIRGRALRVVPVQPVRSGPLRPGGRL